MKSIFKLFALLVFSLYIINTLSQKTCEEIIKSKEDEEKMITEIEANMLDIKQNADK
jgi:hypothetical protein